METILGIRGKDFVMLAADTTQARSIVLMKEDENKIYQVAKNLIVAAVGDFGDTVQFTEFIAKNIALYKMRNGYDLNPRAAAHFTRKHLAEYLRSRTPYQVNMFLAGYEPNEGAELYYVDYLANAKLVKFGGQGYGGMFCASIFDRYYHTNLTEDEAYDILKKCVLEVQKRLVINLKKFNVCIVNKNGVSHMDDITAENLIGYIPRD